MTVLKLVCVECLVWILTQKTQMLDCSPVDWDDGVQLEVSEKLLR